MPVPLGERVLLQKPVEVKEHKTNSGIIVPMSGKEADAQAPTAKVVSISEEASDKIKGRFEVGDTVIYSRFNNDEIVVDGAKYILAPLENVLAKI